MPIFKYTVANKEGKQLSGSIEAPDENTARKELNNLGFSILTLEQSDELPTMQENHKRFVFEAIDKNSQAINGTIPCETKEEALQKLQTQYSLSVTAIWPEGASPEEIQAAKNQGATQLQGNINTEESPEEEATSTKSLQQQKEEQFVKTKIEKILKDVNALLKKFETAFSTEQKLSIHKKIDKLLRIKNSTNLQYVLKVAEDLLSHIQEEEKHLKTEMRKEKVMELKMKTKDLLNQLNSSSKPKSLADDIVQRIDNWKHSKTNKEMNFFERTTFDLLSTTKEFFKTPPTVRSLNQQISSCNNQLLEFAKLYFKEPTPSYKEKVKNSLTAIWNKRERLKEDLKKVKSAIKEHKQKQQQTSSEASTQTPSTQNKNFNLLDEANNLSGWLLGFYIIYYFVSIYITSKDFGLESVPQGFFIYESQVFKYILATLFFLHISIAIKQNFFPKSQGASLALSALFFSGSLLSILNF